MLGQFIHLAVVVGWPKLLLIGVVILIGLTPRGGLWRTGSAALAVIAAILLFFLDCYEKLRLAGEMDKLRQFARTAVIEQRSDKIEATKVSRVIDVMARELISDDPRAVMLHDHATAYDMSLTDAYVEKFIESESVNNPKLAARAALGVFVDRMNAELPETGDNVLYFLAKGYESVFRKLKDVDPQACAAFMQGEGLLNSNAASEFYGAADLAFRTMPDKTRPVSKGTRDEAIAFGERALGRDRLAELMAQKQAFPDTCEDLATIYAAVLTENSPAAFAASRYWLQPHHIIARFSGRDARESPPRQSR